MIDLHTHTTFSDGTLTPTQVVKRAAELGLRAVAITDHDTVDGLDEALEAGRHFDIEVVPGVEINLEHEQVTLDLLGYFFCGSPTAELRGALAELRRYRDERNARILARLREIGYPVTAAELAEVAQGDAVGRPHIAEAMRRRGDVESVADAFQRFLRRGAPAFVDRRRLGLHEAVRLLRLSGGLPSIAHPAIIRTEAAGLERLARAAKRLGVLGLECYYSEHDGAATARCLALAERVGLVPTGGSDFHGDMKPHARLGRGSAGRPIPDRVLAELKRVHREELQG